MSPVDAGLVAQDETPRLELADALDDPLKKVGVLDEQQVRVKDSGVGVVQCFADLLLKSPRFPSPRA